MAWSPLLQGVNQAHPALPWGYIARGCSIPVVYEWGDPISVVHRSHCICIERPGLVWVNRALYKCGILLLLSLTMYTIFMWFMEKQRHHVLKHVLYLVVCDFYTSITHTWLCDNNYGSFSRTEDEGRDLWPWLSDL